MTIGELRELLAQCEDGWLVVLAEDRSGSDYSPLGFAGRGRYVAKTSRSGTVETTPGPANCLVLWPVN